MGEDVKVFGKFFGGVLGFIAFIWVISQISESLAFAVFVATLIAGFATYVIRINRKMEERIRKSPFSSK